MKSFEWKCMDDGYGVVGVSFHCPHCEYFNTFVIEGDDSYQCEECHKESKPEEVIGGDE